jgi:hypothetical protein
MTPQWKNERIEAWTLEDGTLIVKTRVTLDKAEKTGISYTIDTLPLAKKQVA